jgi:hypothetical protein
MQPEQEHLGKHLQGRNGESKPKLSGHKQGQQERVQRTHDTPGHTLRYASVMIIHRRGLPSGGALRTI